MCALKYDGPFSLVIGKRTFLESFISDDAQDPEGIGGCQSLVLGEYGIGKSTLMIWMAQNSHFVKRGSKRGYIHALIHNKSTKGYKLNQTTVLYRLRDADGWPVLIPENWKKRFPGSQPKPMRIFVHKDDINNITFFTRDADHKPIPVPNIPQVIAYKDADDVIDQLLEGGINCCLEPQSYRLSQNLCRVVEQSLSEYRGTGLQKDDRVKDDLEDTPKKRGRGRPIKTKDYSQIAVVPGLFWVDVVNSLMTHWGGKPVHLFADEADDFASMLSSGIAYHVISKYCSWARDFRKLNISTTFSAHGWGLLHDQIYKRSNIKIMMRGCRKSENCMIQYTRIFSGLQKGFFMVERSNVEFGIWHFGPISNPIQCRIDGMAGASRFFSDSVARKIRASYVKGKDPDPIPVYDHSHIGDYIDQFAECEVE